DWSSDVCSSDLFSRLDLTISEKSSWAPVPKQFASANLAYTGVLVWDRPPPKQGANVSIIPYVAGRVSRDYENKVPWKQGLDVGGDIKVGLTPSLNLDLTINPDFSQVDVDVQQTNLDRRSEEHTSELQSRENLVCRLLLE